MRALAPRIKTVCIAATAVHPKPQPHPRSSTPPPPRDIVYVDNIHLATIPIHSLL